MAQTVQHSIGSSNLADLLERILDKGIVIAGDIKIKLVEVELLTIRFDWWCARWKKQKSWALTGGIASPRKLGHKKAGCWQPHLSGLKKGLPAWNTNCYSAYLIRAEAEVLSR